MLARAVPRRAEIRPVLVPLAHLDRVAADRQYKFAMSEIAHLVAMLEFEPKRFKELKARIREGSLAAAMQRHVGVS